jgi:hypothetical protein
MEDYLERNSGHDEGKKEASAEHVERMTVEVEKSNLNPFAHRRGCLRPYHLYGLIANCSSKLRSSRLFWVNRFILTVSSVRSLI